MKILIEGIKLTGKSSLVNRLNEFNRETSIFEFRSHCLLKAPKYTLSPKIDLILESFAMFLKTLNQADYILLRGHIFPYALAKTTDQIIPKNFKEIDKLFLNEELIAVLLTVNQDIFTKRLNERINAGRRVHAWDASWEKMSELQNHYRYYFNETLMPNIIIDTSLIDETTVLNKLLNFIGAIN